MLERAERSWVCSGQLGWGLRRCLLQLLLSVHGVQQSQWSSVERGQKSETLAAWRSSEVITENRRGTPGGDLEKYLAQWADRRTSWFNPS